MIITFVTRWSQIERFCDLSNEDGSEISSRHLELRASYIATKAVITHDLLPLDSLRFPSPPIYSAPALRSGEVRSGSARRWGWQLWRIFFIHVTCLRARKNTFSRTESGSNQGNRTSTYVSRPESSILKFSPSRVYVLVPFDQDRRAVVE